jgi:hypothetical protein
MNPYFDLPRPTAEKTARSNEAACFIKPVAIPGLQAAMRAVQTLRKRGRQQKPADPALITRLSAV